MAVHAVVAVAAAENSAAPPRVSVWSAITGGRGDSAALLLSLFVVAACAILYELLIAAAASYVLGNTVAQYSITIGLFLTALGLGSYLSRQIRRELATMFVLVELAIAVVGGLSAPALFWLYGTANALFQPGLWLMVCLVGTLAGLELPLVTRLLSERGELRVQLANVLSLDYLGGLIGSIAFPLLLLPALGVIRTSIVVGLINCAIATLTTVALRHRLSPIIHWTTLAGSLTIGAGLTVLLANSAPLVMYLEQRVYRDPVIYIEQTPYQRIVLTRWRDDLRLYLDGNLQFSSLDEHRYHETLVHPAMALAARRDSVLVLGGGDGLAIREILKWPDVARVTLVDIDPAMVELARSQPDFRAINRDALADRRVRVVAADAFSFVENDRDFYDVVVADLPDPREEGLQKLYSVEMYGLINRRLSADGVFATQATSSYFAPEAFGSINVTLAQVFRRVLPAHVNVPSFGIWGFALASQAPIEPSAIRLPIATRYLSPEALPGLFRFAADEQIRRDARPNRLFEPVLLDYHRRGWQSTR